MEKRLEMKEWLFRKVASEHNAPKVWSGRIDCIFAETEKAYKVIIGSASYRVITWLPKSGCEWEDAEEGTRTFKTYEEAKEYSDSIKAAWN